MIVDCTCLRCTSPAFGAVGFDHCAACCAGSLIAEYDHDCPIPEHREWALIQFPPSMRLAAAEVEP